MAAHAHWPARVRRLAILLLFVACAFLTVGRAAPAAPDPALPRVLLLEVRTEITPVVADYVDDGLDRAAREGFDALVIALDTPGGLVTSMRDIIQDILGSAVPVIVHVSPEGARAASAGAVITLASHVAVMAPATSIGAATPVGLGGQDVGDKLVNDAAAQAVSLARLRDRNVEVAESMVRDGRALDVAEAIRQDVVDARAATLAEALAVADGRAVETAAGTTTLRTAGATVVTEQLGFLRGIQQMLANPNLTYLLLTLGTLGLLYELAGPGVGIGGAVGAVSLVLALFSMAVLPVNLVGLLLLAIAAALFVAELFVPAAGGFAVGGAVVLVLAGTFLFDDAQGVAVDHEVLVPTAIVAAALAFIAGRLVLRAQRAPKPGAATQALTRRAVTVTDVRQGDGVVHARAFADGTWWSVRSDQPLQEGEPAEVLGLDGLTLLVRPAPATGPADPAQDPPRPKDPFREGPAKEDT